MIKLLKYLKPKQWILIFASILLIFLQVYLELGIPDYMEKITKILQNPNTDSTKEIWTQGSYMLISALGSLLSAAVVGFFMSRISAFYSQELRSAMFNKVDSFSKQEINNFQTSSLITRTTNDVTQIQMFVTMGLQLLIKAPILAVWAIIKIANKGKEWSLATLVTVILLSIVIGIVMIFVVPKFKKVQKSMDELTLQTRENLTGVRVVRAYNAEEFQKNKFEKANQELAKINLFTTRSTSVLNPIMTFLMSLLSLSIYVIGAYLIKDANNYLEQSEILTNMTVFTQYAMQVIMAYIMLVMIFFLLPRTVVASKRINEVLDTKLTITDGNLKSDSTKGEISFKNVSFKYPGASENVLTDISFDVKKGETVAFIGSTGSGKSTLINLIPRFYDATSGEVLIDKINVKDFKMQDLNNKIGYVPQKAVLFRGTVRSNINFGESEHVLTDEEIWEALETSMASDFVRNLELKLDSDIAQAGTNLSGGQKQRLSIARALARKPEILIFDDSFSALDYKTDKILRENLKKTNKETTVFIVAQRIGTILGADKIVVLDKGKIVGIGKHHELLETCRIYKEIAMSQLSEEELA